MAFDCVVIGGGVIGLTTAWRLAQQGLSVRVCDRAAPGREASWAGAGILPPGHPGSPSDPLTLLTARTCELWPEMTAELREFTGLDNQFQALRRIGIVSRLGGRSGRLPREMDSHRSEDRVARCISHSRTRTAVLRGEAGFLLPDLCQVRNPRHLQALLRACELAGVVITSHCPVTGWTSSNGRITAAVTPNENIAAGQFIVTAGAWSPQLLAQAGITAEIVPVRGQIVQLAPSTITLTRVIEREKRYIVPRLDGRILIGSTEELVGFEKENTTEGTAGLIEFASAICPALRTVPIEHRWSGLRPCAVRNRPFIGQVPGLENLIVATGHFRSGLHLSPATAEIVVSTIQGHCPKPAWLEFGVSL